MMLTPDAEFGAMMACNNLNDFLGIMNMICLLRGVRQYCITTRCKHARSTAEGQMLRQRPRSVGCFVWFPRVPLPTLDHPVGTSPSRLLPVIGVYHRLLPAAVSRP